MRRRNPNTGILALGVALALAVVAPAWSKNHVITWGTNSSGWNKALGVDGVRLGCSDAPPSCVNSAGQLAQSQRVDNAFLATLFDAARADDQAATYSRLSLAYPALREVGFDDFVSQCEKQRMSFADVSSALVVFARQLKSVNRGLNLGITLYMDQVSSSSFPLANLDRDFRTRVDYVHLYPHYRREAESFSVSAAKVRAIFPNARIIAGLYPYDRRDYLPCERGKSALCSNADEIARFKDSLNERLAMLKDGAIEAIEFYPGNFGAEEQWSGWQNPRSCRADRRSECVANTQAMRSILRDTLTKNASVTASSSGQGARPR